MKSPESQLQQALMRWWSVAHAGLYCPEELLFAIPNGGVRNIATAVRLKREGVRAGVPDLFLAAPGKSTHGLFIELKAGKAGRVSESQRQMLNLLESHGYNCAVCRTLEQAIEAITSHLTK